jgi:hypothetical protein
MPRPKDPIEKSYQFHSRLTPGEGAAVEEMVKRWIAEMVAKDPLWSGDRTTWFRQLVRREAARMGVEIVEPTAAPAAPVASELPKAKKKRGE